MTAQIGILNKKAVVLATDSALTINNSGKEKSFNTAEKLFEMIRGRAIGIMIYNQANFNSVPWEILIKEYGKKNTETHLDSLEEYNTSFFNYVVNNKWFNDEYGEQDRIIELTIEIVSLILDRTNELIESNEELVDEDIVKNLLVNAFIEKKKYFDKIGIYPDFQDLVQEDYLKKYDAVIENILREKINGDVLDVTDEEYFEFVKIVKKGILSNYKGESFTGIVIAGYGDAEYFPSLYQTEVYLILQGIMKMEKIGEIVIGKSCQPEVSTAALVPLAQHDMVDTFIQGISPELEGITLQMLGDVLDVYEEKVFELLENAEISDAVKKKLETALISPKKQLVELSHNVLQKIIRESNTEPILTMIGSLGKQQLAEMAETLINLTSFKKKMSMDNESVGGPIDIAVISKNEGLIWIKRKHYFDKNLNPYYFK